MSDESTTDASADDAAKGEPNHPTSPESRPSGRLARVLPTFETGYVQEVWLDVWSGNAEIQFNFQDLVSGPTLSLAQKLAADIAMAHDVLADLPT